MPVICCEWIITSLLLARWVSCLLNYERRNVSTGKMYLYYSIWGELVENGLSLCVWVRENKRERENIFKTKHLFNCCPVLWLPGEQEAHPSGGDVRVFWCMKLGPLLEMPHTLLCQLSLYSDLGDYIFCKTVITLQGNVIKYILRLRSYLCPIPLGTHWLTHFFFF